MGSQADLSRAKTAATAASATTTTSKSCAALARALLISPQPRERGSLVIFSDKGTVYRVYTHPDALLGCNWCPTHENVIATGCKVSAPPLFDTRVLAELGPPPPLMMVSGVAVGHSSGGRHQSVTINQNRTAKGCLSRRPPSRSPPILVERPV